MNNTALTEGQKQDQLKELKKSGAISLQGILTEEQRAKLTEMRKAKRDNSGIDSTSVF